MSAIEQNGRDGVSSAERHINTQFWLWCMERDISIQAQHLAGKLNSTVDEESRVLKDRSGWMLCREIFQKINRQLGPLEVDLFALNSTPNLCELETVPRSDDHRCLHNVVVRAEGLCQTTVEPSGQGPSPSPATAGISSPDCPSSNLFSLLPCR